MPDFHDRLSSWRREVDVISPTASATGMVSEDLRRKQLRLSSLILAHQQRHDEFVTDIMAYVTSRKREPEHQQRVTDYAAFLLRAYEGNSTYALKQAIAYVLQDLPREVIRVQEKPVPQPSLLKRLIGW
jgi:hypothetical protein